MTRTDIRWVIAIPNPAGGLHPFRLAPLGAVLEFRAPDCQAAERMVVASQATLPDDAVLILRLEFDDLERSTIGRYLPPRRLRQPKAASA